MHRGDQIETGNIAIRENWMKYYLFLKCEEDDQSTDHPSNDHHKQYHKPKYLAFRDIKTLESKLYFIKEESRTEISFFNSSSLNGLYIPLDPYGCS